MTIEQVVLEHVRSAAGVAAIVGARVYQLRLPQTPILPAVRVQLIDEPTEYHLRGANRLYRARVQLDCFAQEASGSDPYAGATALAAAVDSVLSGAKFTDGSPVTITVTGTFREARRVLYEPEEFRIVRVMQDYLVWFEV